MSFPVPQQPAPRRWFPCCGSQLLGRVHGFPWPVKSTDDDARVQPTEGQCTYDTSDAAGCNRWMKQNPRHYYSYAGEALQSSARPSPKKRAGDSSTSFEAFLSVCLGARWPQRTRATAGSAREDIADRLDKRPPGPLSELEGSIQSQRPRSLCGDESPGKLSACLWNLDQKVMAAGIHAP